MKAYAVKLGGKWYAGSGKYGDIPKFYNTIGKAKNAAHNMEHQVPRDVLEKALFLADSSIVCFDLDLSGIEKVDIIVEEVPGYREYTFTFADSLAKKQKKEKKKRKV